MTGARLETAKLSQEGLNATGMTIGDFMHNLGVTQGLYEVRLEEGQHAARILDKVRVREAEVQALMNGKRAAVRAIQEKLDRLDKKDPNVQVKIRGLLEKLRDERGKLQDDGEYRRLEAELKELRTIIMRARIKANLTPHESPSLKDGGKIRRW